MYIAYLGPIQVTLDNVEFTLDNMEFTLEFTLDNIEFTLDKITPVLQVQLFEIKCYMFYAFSVVSIRTNKNFLNLN